MAFRRLADFVVRRYGLIIAAWIAVLFYIFPLTLSVNDVVVYQESETGLEDLEAMEAQRVIDENFAGVIPPSTIMIVVQNSNVLSPEVRNFTWELNRQITSDSLPGVQNVSYLYTTLQYYYAELALQIVKIFDLVNRTSQLVYGVPLQLAYTHMSILANSGYTLPDEVVQQMVLDGLNASLVSSGADENTIAATIGYANAFYPIWLPSHSLDVDVLTQLIRSASATYFGQLGGELGTFAVMLGQQLNASTYDSVPALREFTKGMLVIQTGVRPDFVDEVWLLGPAPSFAQASELAATTILTRDFDELPLIPDFIVSQFVNTGTEAGGANDTMLIVLTLSVDASSEVASQLVRDLRAIVAENIEVAGPGIQVYVSGNPALNLDIMDAVKRDVNKIDVVTVTLVVLLVGLFFRSAVTPWVPLMTVGMAYLTSSALVYLIGKFVLEIHYSVLTIMLTVMLGAGTDYCIFIMSRYREERVLGRSKEDAVRTSLIWAGESIATSGATVMLGFGVLMIGSYPLVRSMGMALVISVGIALMFALTMLPSLIMLVGDRVFWPHKVDAEKLRMEERARRGGGYFKKSANFGLRHSKAIVLAALVITVPAAYLVLSLETSYDFIAALPDAESKRGLDAMGTGFGKGNIMPTYVVVTFDEPVMSDDFLSPDVASQLEAYCERLLGVDNVRSVTGPTRPFGEPVNTSFLENLSADDRAKYDYAIGRAVGSDGRTVMLTVILQDEPFTTRSIHTVDRIRDLDSDRSLFGGSVRVLVGGSTASMADVSRSVSNDFFTMRIVVIIGIYFVLLLVLGSLIMPLRLILTVLLTVSWTIAMTMIVFEFASGVPVLWLMPLILFVVAMGLGMDYDIFLTTRIREEVSKGKTDEEAILTAVERTGGIITACGVIMAGAFGSMMLSSTALLREFGFGLAFAIVLDAMIVRIYLVPAIMLLLRKWNWYAPGRLQRTRREEKSRKRPRKD
ncbi:MAG: MMPL family transporter [Thermoplasmata archaeon]